MDQLISRSRLGWVVARAGVLAALAACTRFNPGSFTQPESLYHATMREFRHGRFTRAQSGFQKLVFDLPARDTIHVRARFYLAETYFGLRDYVTAAREFRRVADDFPADVLAPDALLRAGDSYRQLWRRAELDASNGETAVATYQELLGRYPRSRAAAIAQARIRELNEQFARKDFMAGTFYLRRGAYDSAILYFRQVIARYPSSSLVPDAYIRMVRAYRAIGYREEMEETCEHLREHFGARADVREECGDRGIRR
ncbi:MAG TPA: outer membrane protein assembly factor BamD [Gemmatimonadales bacterium]|nr:outer membrane protein assembly factor BamD [Gemmatimonadales bacterium]